MFRGKESSNRIKLSQLVQDLLNFGVLGSLQLWGGRWVDGVGGMWMGWGWVDGVGVGGWDGGALHTHAHACAHMHTHTHACVVISCKWLLPLDFWGIPGNSL